MSARPWFDLSGLPPPQRTADLGTHRNQITVADDQARALFDQGLIYAYGFNHLEALRAFRHAQSLDPGCAMCFWAEAYVLGPNLNLPMEPEAAAIARAAAEKAVEKAASTTPKEQALAGAMLVRYSGPGERADLDRKYADAMLRVAAYGRNAEACGDVPAVGAHEATLRLADRQLRAATISRKHPAPRRASTRTGGPAF